MRRVWCAILCILSVSCSAADKPRVTLIVAGSSLMEKGETAGAGKASRVTMLGPGRVVSVDTAG